MLMIDEFIHCFALVCVMLHVAHVVTTAAAQLLMAMVLQIA
jgi:hypothetical protein